MATNCACESGLSVFDFADTRNSCLVLDLDPVASPRPSVSRRQTDPYVAPRVGSGSGQGSPRLSLGAAHLSFSVRPGMVTAFLRPNGSGKSTTMRMILGLDRRRYRPRHDAGDRS
ncbi:MAG TPA: ATP-binding cassette domain-containing protein [Acidothermaceae bacterium]